MTQKSSEKKILVALTNELIMDNCFLVKVEVVRACVRACVLMNN